MGQELVPKREGFRDNEPRFLMEPMIAGLPYIYIRIAEISPDKHDLGRV